MSTQSEEPKRLYVLLVDDCEGDYLLTQIYLNEMSGFEVILTWEPDATKLSQHLQARRWDLILLDAYLGGHSALDLLPQIKAGGNHTHRFK